MVASQYVHPEFGFFCPSPRFRRRLRLTLACLLVAGVGATMMAPADRPGSDAAVTRVDAASIVETLPATSLTPFAPLSSNRTVVEGTHSASDKPRCVGDALADLDGNCVSIKLRKPRMVRAATDRPAIAAVALAALHHFPLATSTPLFPLPAPAAKATLRSQARAHPLPSRSRVRLSPPRRRLLRPRRHRGWRTVKTNAATRTGMALRPGARCGSTIGLRAATRRGRATTSGADTARASCKISGNRVAST